MAAPTHKLAVLGDSLSQGFMSGAIHRTDISYPAMIARALGGEFDAPRFEGEGGLPLNIELLLRNMSERFGERINWHEAVPMLARSRGFMDRVEDYWERGRGIRPMPEKIHHNQAVWGMEVSDAVIVTEGYCSSALKKPSDDLIQQVPEQAMYRSIRRTLNPSLGGAGSHRTATDNLIELSRRGGIENVIVALGANNALGTVLSLKVIDSKPEEIFFPPDKRKGNLYLPEHFELAYERLVRELEQMQAENVFLVNVPHVTIPPITRGINLDGSEPTPATPGGRRYYDYYTRLWIWDEDFDPHTHPKITREEAIRIDAYIDAYNRTIEQAAGLHENWHVVDICSLLDRFAVRSRPGGNASPEFPAPLVSAIQRNSHLSYLVQGGQPTLDTRYYHLKSSPEGEPYRIYEGGLFSLDGVHPTTLGYSLFANEILERMKAVGAADSQVELPWDDLVAADTLAAAPPALLTNLRACLRSLEKSWGLSGVIQSFLA